MQEFTGRTAVITGGASGIGLGMARSFAKRGMRAASGVPKRRSSRSATGCASRAWLGTTPRVHKAIVLDEPSRDLVNGSKVLLQASLEGTELYQSPTQRFTRWVWVYAVPIIICTNEWLKDEDVDANAQWIRANSVHVRVTDYLWER